MRKAPGAAKRLKVWAGFNEAALFQVRKGMPMKVTKDSKTMSFNEAALFQVRKEDIQAQHQLQLHPASMRPHSFKCGKCGLDDASAAAMAELQ